MARHAAITALCLLLAIAPFVAPPVRAARSQATHDLLVGTWQVHRTCVTGCSQSVGATVTVTAQGHHAYAGAGSQQPLELYQISSTQVVVHAKSASSLLTIKTRGQYMRGIGVGKHGETFVTEWHCLTGPTGRGGHCGT